MICEHCGKENKDASSFCGFCGEAFDVKTEKKCPVCGRKYPASKSYCDKCGVILKKIAPAGDELIISSGKAKTGVKPALKMKGFRADTAPVKEKPAVTVPERKPGKKPEKVLKSVSVFPGKPAVGIPSATGALEIYDREMVFRKSEETAGKPIFYPFSEMISAEKGVFSAVIPAITVTMKDKKVITFIRMMDDNEIAETVMLIENRINKQEE